MSFFQLGATLLHAQCHIHIFCTPGFTIMISIVILSQYTQMRRGKLFLWCPEGEFINYRFM